MLEEESMRSQPHEHTSLFLLYDCIYLDQAMFNAAQL